jgi:hypothetical protein
MSPPLENMYWMYKTKRWQSRYDEIKRTMYHKVEFAQDAPLDLDKNSFIDSTFCHLLIIDDLVSTKRPKDNGYIYRGGGSHHMNLSVKALNQNLYFSKDPT